MKTTRNAGAWDTQASASKDNMAGNSKKKKTKKGKVIKRKKQRRERKFNHGKRDEGDQVSG